MVFASICEHASSAFTFNFIFASSEHFRKNPSVRAVAEFCEREQPSGHLFFASKSRKGKIVRTPLN